MKIMVALDGSDHALAGLELVASLTLTPDDELVLVSVAETDQIDARRFRRLHRRHLELLLQAEWASGRAAATQSLEAGRVHLGAWQTPVSQMVRSGHPVREIAAAVEEERADLLVLGPRGRGRLSALLLGSVTESLLGLARCPVVVARRPIRGPRRVILAADGSVHAEAATRVLVTFPLPSDAEVEVVTVARVGTPWLATHDDTGEGDGAWLVDAQQDLARAIAGEAVARLTAAGLRARATIRTGEPGRELVAAVLAGDADLVVVGSLGAAGVRDRLLGSVSRRVASTAPCTVLVVADHTPARGPDRSPAR